jgi:GntR family transcriptional regulator
MVSVLVKEPIYHQLTNHLRQLIASHEYPVGSKFLTERQICERFGVSRATANKVLSGLVSEGVLDFRKGVGTFVRIRTLDYNLQVLVSFTEEAQAAGKRPTTEVLRFESVQARDVLDEVPELLQAGPDVMLYYLERLRLADNLPVIYERRHMVAEYCPGLTKSDLAGSLYELWTKRYGLAIEGADERVQAVNLRGAEALALKVRNGAAGLRVSSVGYLTGRRPLWCESTLYRGDAYEFRNRLGGLQPASHARGMFLYPGESISGEPGFAGQALPPAEGSRER